MQRPIAMSSAVTPDQASRPQTIYRHRVATRVWHWLNALAILTLLGSGMMISNAHPHLYWGKYGANFDRPWWNPPTFPSFVTIPSTYNLAMGRRWHLFFALVLAFGLLGYMVASLINKHFLRDLTVRLRELRPAHLWSDFRAHLNFRFHDPERPGDYNIFQKLIYVGVIFILIPLAILTGLALSPGMDAAWPWLLMLLGGRQTARSIHFLAASGLALFTVVHLVLVILAGAWSELRSIVTGWWVVPEEKRA